MFSYFLKGLFYSKIILDNEIETQQLIEINLISQRLHMDFSGERLAGFLVFVTFWFNLFMSNKGQDHM